MQPCNASSCDGSDDEDKMVKPTANHKAARSPTTSTNLTQSTNITGRMMRPHTNTMLMSMMSDHTEFPGFDNDVGDTLSVADSDDEYDTGHRDAFCDFNQVTFAGVRNADNAWWRIKELEDPFLDGDSSVDFEFYRAPIRIASWAARRQSTGERVDEDDAPPMFVGIDECCCTQRGACLDFGLMYPSDPDAGDVASNEKPSSDSSPKSWPTNPERCREPVGHHATEEQTLAVQEPPAIRGFSSTNDKQASFEQCGSLAWSFRALRRSNLRSSEQQQLQQQQEQLQEGVARAMLDAGAVIVPNTPRPARWQNRLGRTYTRGL